MDLGQGGRTEAEVLRAGRQRRKERTAVDRILYGLVIVFLCWLYISKNRDLSYYKSENELLERRLQDKENWKEQWKEFCERDVARREKDCDEREQKTCQIIPKIVEEEITRMPARINMEIPAVILEDAIGLVRYRVEKFQEDFFNCVSEAGVSAYAVSRITFEITERLDDEQCFNKGNLTEKGKQWCDLCEQVYDKATGAGIITPDERQKIASKSQDCIRAWKAYYSEESDEMEEDRNAAE